MGNALNALSSATKEDTKLYNCIKELYEQGVPFSDLKALIPDMKRTREQLQIKRMLENNNEVLVSMLSKEMGFLLDARERAPGGAIPETGSAHTPAAKLPERICQACCSKAAEETSLSIITKRTSPP